MTTPCPHHWLLGELADLPKGEAWCKLCGITKPMPDVWIEEPYADLQRRTHGRGKAHTEHILWTSNRTGA